MIKYICDFCGEEIEYVMEKHFPITLTGRDNRSNDLVYKLELCNECADQVVKKIKSFVANLKPGTIGG